ncbi:putative DNA binding domain-containing protein [Legionella pneumophila serogroup 1]
MIFEINTLDDIDLLRESEELECKKAAGSDGNGQLPNDFWETYSAMANTSGGYVLLGIEQKKDTFTLHGLKNIHKVHKQLVDTANNKNKVSVSLLTNAHIKEIIIDGKNILQIYIPRASRQQKPVYLNGNPLGGNTYQRLHEADQKLSDDAVKRMLAEQVEDSRDNRILKGFGFNEIHEPTLRAYRQIFSNRTPDNPWNQEPDLNFLKRIGAWRKDRETHEEGLTLAGLLMFGTHPVIQEVLPFYMLDYQERPEAKTEKRWIDRVTLDGSWSGNLYDFYRKVYLKLTNNLKVPFTLDGDQRRDETSVHVAIREALVNVLVHADYTERASVLVVKRPDLFGFRNPGLMRITLDAALEGGYHDCRNRLLHQMFRYVGIGDQAGSGIPKIMSGWQDNHWRSPELVEQREPFDQTILHMRMIDLFPAGIVEKLRTLFSGEYDELEHAAQVALAIAASEGTVTHEKLKIHTKLHAAYLSHILRGLVRKHLLYQTGASRGSVYHLPGFETPNPEDVFDDSLLPQNIDSSRNNEESSRNNAGSSRNNEESSRNSDSNRDKDGCLISGHIELPIIDSLENLSEHLRDALLLLAKPVREKKRVDPEALNDIILNICTNRYITISALSDILKRQPETLRRQYLSGLVRSKLLVMAFPKTPNDPRQAYSKPTNI